MKKQKVEIEKNFERGPKISLTEDLLTALGQIMTKLEDQFAKSSLISNFKPSDENQKRYANCLEICEFLLYIDDNDKIINKAGLVTLDVSKTRDYFDVVVNRSKDSIVTKETGTAKAYGIISYFILETLEEMKTNLELKKEAEELPIFQTSGLNKEKLKTIIPDFLIFYNRFVEGKPIISDKTSKPTTTTTYKSNKYDDYDDWYGTYYDKDKYKTSGYGRSYGSGYGQGYGTKDYSLSRGEVVNVPPFSYNPRDVRSTFLSLTTETYPHGHEEEVMKYLPVPGLQKDQWGNYYLIIGNSDNMFTSHLDTASRVKGPVRILSYNENGDEIFVTDGTSILGADDKAGVAVMLYMISHNVPGVYYFFIGEERGAVGSSKVAENFDTIEHLRGIKKCISFDRRNYYSVITSQLSQSCCSDLFAQSLCQTLNAGGLELRLDNTGVFTDSASFMDLIPECTNVSVGYFSEHTHQEKQNITYLQKLAKACVSADWNSLVIKRRVGLDPAISARFGPLITKLKRSRMWKPKEAFTDEENFYIKLKVDETPVLTVKRELESYKRIFDENNVEPTISFDTGYIKFKFV